MLKELLPKLSHRLKPNPVKELSVNEEGAGLSDPNLLDSYDYSSLRSTHFTNQAITTLRIFILLVPVIFVASLFVNDIVDLRISLTKKSIASLNRDLSDLQDVKNKADQVYRKTEILKKIRVAHPVSSKMDWIVSQTPPNITLRNLKYTENTFKIQAISDTALGISLLINNYFENPAVSDIMLKGAELEQGSRNFKVTLEVSFSQ
jgi:hypothetical protein